MEQLLGSDDQQSANRAVEAVVVVEADVLLVAPRSLGASLGPGLVTGAADDDPSGIATYSQVGTQFGFAMLWIVLFSLPLMIAIQDITARVGRVTGRGLAGNLRRSASSATLCAVISLLATANLINLAADIGAMGAALQLVLGGHAGLYAIFCAGGSLFLQTVLPYTRYVAVLKWLTLALFAYVATVLVVHVPWGAALYATLVPSIAWTPGYLAGLVAVLGTTISPYLFFWQASEEAEDVNDTPGDAPLVVVPGGAQRQLRRIDFDTIVGMTFSNIVAFFIILTAAVTLRAQGQVSIETAADAAAALRPVAGELAFALFALGVVGTGLLAVPVLAGSVAYAVSEALGWPSGLERKPSEARGFYSVLALATLSGLGLTFSSIDPIKALFWSSVINGVLAGPIMVVLMRLATDPQVMGAFTIPRWLRVLGWLATGVMFAAAGGLVATWGQ